MYYYYDVILLLTCGIAKLATDRLQTIFRSILLRRKKDSVCPLLEAKQARPLIWAQMLDGKRLIELPNKQVILVRLEFSKDERDIYTMVCSDTALYRSLTDTVYRLRASRRRCSTGTCVRELCSSEYTLDHRRRSRADLVP